MEPSLKFINVVDLVFDPENPRLPESLAGAADSEIIEFFIRQCNLPELMMSIAEKGFFSGEPILVVEQLGGKFLAVEGNRRLAAVKLISSTDPAPVQQKLIDQIREGANHRPATIPCLVFSARSDILLYLGYRHITGIKEWDSLAKARYLKQLRETFDADDHVAAHRALAKQIGSKAATVAKMLTGLKVLEYAGSEGILKELKLEQDDIPFSLLTTGIGWESLANFIGLEGPGDVTLADINKDRTSEFFSWVFFKVDGRKTKLGESRNFEKLARIVKIPEALEALRSGDSIVSADLLTEGPLQAIRSNIQIAINAIEHAQDSLRLVESLNESDQISGERLKRVANILSSSIAAVVVAGKVEDQ